MKTKIIESCIWCLGHAALCVLCATLLLAFAIMGCHVFGLDTTWVQGIL